MRRASVCGSTAGVALRLRFARRSLPPFAPRSPLSDRRPKRLPLHHPRSLDSILSSPARSSIMLARQCEIRCRFPDSEPTTSAAAARLVCNCDSPAQPIVKRKDLNAHDGYCTKHVILEIYDAPAESMQTEKPYQTKLNPAPADPRCCHPPRPQR